MDCNKDEAIRAKEIAEKKLIEKDISGAKRFVSKAQTLFPELEGLSQFQEILDVYTASERKVNGVVDWYGVLGVDPLANDETIRKKYRKLALALHPDKNKAVGADGAFKILSEAWSLLSDKIKRVAYDQKRNIKAVGAEKNARCNVTNSSLAEKNSSVPSNPQTDSTPSRSNANTFWTSCNRCMMQYEYSSIYQNHNLLCPNCRQPFLATEMPPPPAKHNGLRRQYRKERKQQRGHPANNTSSDLGRKFTSTPKMEVPGFSGFESSRENVPPSFNFGGSRSVPTATNDATQHVHSFHLKRGHQEAFIGTINVEDAGKKGNDFKNTDGLRNGPVSSKGEKPAKKRRVDDNKATLGRKNFLNQMPPAGASSGSNNDSGNQMGRSETGKFIIPGTNKSRSSRELSQAETRIMLMEKAKMEIRKKLQEWHAANNTLSSGEVDKEMWKDMPTSVSALEKSVVPGRMNARDMNTSNKGEHIFFQPKRSSSSSMATYSDSKPTKVTSVGVHTSDGLKESSQSSLAAGSDTKVHEIITMSVPDPEFYDFDKDRMERVFAENQVWAAYDDEDGMPRYYAIIHEVISRKPFKVRISWLNSKSNSEFGLLNWVGCGFTKTCGDFRIGKHVVNKNLNSFSHPVKWAKGSRGVIHIFPEKGDVWALYRNWSADWNELTPDGVIRQYDMVEVVGDYNDKQGVAVVPLVKVAGFRSVFRQHEDSTKVYTIPREEMFRLSHQVPSYILTGHEAEAAPKGCQELDTAAMPLELLQVIKKVRATEGGKTPEGGTEMGDEDATMISGDRKEVVRGEILMYSRKNKGRKVVGGTGGEKEGTM